MISALARKLAQDGPHGPVSAGYGPGVHIGTPLEKGGTLSPVECGKEADSGSSNTAVLRAPDKKSEHTESSKTQPSKPIQIRTSLREASAQNRSTKKFHVILIKEGLGNLKDCFYYTKSCLQDAATLRIFEGKKCFADHPSSLEEQIRPERSTRDIIGYFEEVKFEEVEGVGCLTSILCVMNDQPNEWAMSLLTNSLEFARKYQESNTVGDFVGLSINASGEAVSVAIDEFMSQNDIPESAKAKLALAKSEGITEIRPVSVLKEAISCDLVTEAGAGGQILKMIEGNFMKQKHEADVDKKEKKMEDGDKKASPGMDPGHDDAAQDKDLFAKMIKQYLGDDHPANEETMEMAKHAHQAYQSEGMNEQEAFEAAGKHLKMALKIGQNMMKPKDDKKDDGDGDDDSKEASEKEPKESKEEEAEESKEDESKEKKESAHIKLSAENAKLRESLKKYELAAHLDKKLAASKLPNSVTKKFREALGTPKSVSHIEDTLKFFIAAYGAKSEEVGSDDIGFVFTEKNAFRESEDEGKISLSDCVD